jgi:hypothetical protein
MTCAIRITTETCAWIRPTLEVAIFYERHSSSRIRIAFPAHRHCHLHRNKKDYVLALLDSPWQSVSELSDLIVDNDSSDHTRKRCSRGSLR